VLTVSDEDGGSNSVDSTFTVANVAPTPTIATISTPRIEGTAIAVTGSASDPAGTNDTITLTWEVFKGTGSTVLYASGSGVNFSFTPDDNETYRIKLTASDEDLGSLSTIQDVLVANVAPTASLSVSGPTSVSTGTPVTVTSTTDDPAGANDPLVLSWTITRDGNPFETQSGGTSYSFTPTIAGTYVVTLLVDDGDLGTATVSQQILVSTPPTVAISTAPDGVFQVASQFTFTATDIDTEDQGAGFQFFIQWGDGTSTTINSLPGQNSVTISHTYAGVSASGAYTISATAMDARNATGPATTASFVVLGWSVMSDPLHPSDAILVIVGSEGADTIKVKTKDNDYYRVSVKDRDDDVLRKGTVYGNVNRILVFGHGGNDKITIDDDVTASVQAWGGAADDDIKGGSGNDLILGESGNDNLWGGDGRDILIGGKGADKIHGDKNDDILIGGFTAYENEFNQSAPSAFSSALRLSFENQRVALESILSEWESSRTYLERRDNIRGTGTGARANANYFFKVDDNVMTNNTVFEDDAKDTLWGDQGTDWFFANLSGGVLDEIKDRTNNETEEDADKWW
jgi:RTX calcium-binding nonapeptide repeat (4 copies)